MTIKFERRWKDIRIVILMPWFHKRRDASDETRRKISASLKRSAAKRKDAGLTLLDGER